MKRKKILSLISMSSLVWIFNQSCLLTFFCGKSTFNENVIFKISADKAFKFTQNLIIDKKDEKTSKYYNHINFQMKDTAEWNIFLHISIKKLNELENFLMEQNNYSSSIYSIKEFLENENLVYLIDSYGNQLNFIECLLKKSHTNGDEDVGVHEFNYKLSVQNSLLYNLNKNVSITYLYNDQPSEYTSLALIFPFSLHDLYLTYVPSFGHISSYFQLSLNITEADQTIFFNSTNLLISDISDTPSMISINEENFDKKMILDFTNLSINPINSYSKVPIINIFSKKLWEYYSDNLDEQRIGDLFFNPSNNWIEIYFSDLEILWFDGHISSVEECEKLFQTNLFGFTIKLSFDYWYRDNYETNWTNGNIDEKENYKQIEFQEIYNDQEKIIGYKIRLQEWIPDLTWYEGNNFYYYYDYTHAYSFNWSIIKNEKNLSTVSSFKTIFYIQKT